MKNFSLKNAFINGIGSVLAIPVLLTITAVDKLKVKNYAELVLVSAGTGALVVGVPIGMALVFGPWAAVSYIAGVVCICMVSGILQELSKVKNG